MKIFIITLCLFFSLFTTINAESLYFSAESVSQNSFNSLLQKDKFAHLTTSCFLYCWNYKVLNDFCQMDSQTSKYFSFSLVSIMGFSKEYMDAKKPNNHFSYEDLIFNLLGSVTGFLICK